MNADGKAYDVIIVGGGLGGMLSAAILARRRRAGEPHRRAVQSSIAAAFAFRDLPRLRDHRRAGGADGCRGSVGAALCRVDRWLIRARPRDAATSRIHLRLVAGRGETAGLAEIRL